jgi:ribonuclease Y
VLLLDANIFSIVIGVLIGVGSALVIVWIRKKQQQAELQIAQNTAARIIDEAKKDANAIKKEAEIYARDSVQQERIEFDKEVRETRRELQQGRGIGKTDRFYRKTGE